jgi:hypothetical protein
MPLLERRDMEGGLPVVKGDNKTTAEGGVDACSRRAAGY